MTPRPRAVPAKIQRKVERSAAPAVRKAARTTKRALGATQGAGEGSPFLLVGPSALRDSASLTLLALVRWTRRELADPPRGVLLASGPLQEEFRAAGVRVLGEPASPLYFAERVARRLGHPKAAKAARLARHAPVYLRPPAPRVVFASTVQAAGPTLRFLPQGARLVTHAFESGDLLDELVNPVMMQRLRKATTLWMAASEDVAAGLVERGVEPGRVVLCEPFIDQPHADPPAVRRNIDSLGLAPGEVVVGGIGRSNWHDAPDAFLRVASIVKRRWPDLKVRFVWVGAPQDGPTRWILEHDIRHAGLVDVVTLTGDLRDIDTWIPAFDVLTLTTRVDPSPPAGLQAGGLGIPVVSFSVTAEPKPPTAASGPRPAPTEEPFDDLDDDGVERVPYLDVEAMAERVAQLVRSTEARATAGARHQEAVLVNRRARDGAAAMWELLEMAAYGRATPREASR